MDEIRGMYGDLMVFAVDVNDDLVSVDVYGGVDAVIGNLGFFISDPKKRAAAVRSLALWEARQTPLIYIEEEDGIGRLLEMPA